MANDIYWVDSDNFDGDRHTVGFNDWSEAADYYEDCTNDEFVSSARFSDSADKTIADYLSV